MTERSIVAKIRADVTGYVSGMKQAKVATDQVGDSAKQTEGKASGAFGRLGALAKTNADDLNRVGTAAMVAGGAIVAGLGYGVKAFADFDKAMSSVSAALPQAGAQMGALRQLAIDLGKDTQYSASEAAQGITELAKAGVSAEAILGGGLKGALNLAASGQMDVAEASETAATAMTMFKLSGKDVPHIADLLAAGAGKAQGSVRDLGMALKQAGLVASQTGLSIEETTGGLAAFASAGLIGSDAGTSFKSMLQRLTPQSKEAEKAMADLGISAYDSQGNFIGLAQFAGNLRDSLSGLTTEQRNAAMATIFGSDAVRAASVIYEQGSSGIQSWIDQVNDAGYAAEQARKLTDNWYGDLERLSGAVDTVFVQNGSAANDALRSLTQTVEGAVEAFGSLPGWVQQGALGLTGITGVALLAGGAFLKVVTSGRELLDSLDAIHARGGRAEAALSNAGKAAAVAAKSMAVLAVAGALSSTTGENAVGLNQLTKALLSSSDAAGELNKILAEGSNLGGIYDGAIRDIGTALDAAFAPGIAQQIDNIGGSILSMFGGRNSSDIARAKDQFKEVGESLASLVQSGNADRAAAIFDQIAVKAKESGYSVDQLKSLMPPYAEALAGAEVQGQATADTMGEIGTSAKDATVSVSDLADAVRGFGNSAISAEAAEAAFQAAVDDAAASVREHGQTVDESRTKIDLSTEAGRANSAALRELASYTRDSAAAMIENGGAAADAAAKVEQGRQAFVESAIQMGLTEAAANALADQYGLIPSRVETLVSAPGATQASSEVGNFTRIVNGVPRFVSTTVRASVYGLGDLEYALSLIRQMNAAGGRYAVAGVSTRGGSTINADGGLYDLAAGRLWKSYASGGVASLPSIGWQQPQIQPNRGPAGIQWSETGAGPWEAYTSGHPLKRARSRAITEEVAARLGGQVSWESYAEGAIRGATTYTTRNVGSSSSSPTGLDPAVIRAALDGATLRLGPVDSITREVTAQLVTAYSRSV